MVTSSFPSRARWQDHNEKGVVFNASEALPGPKLQADMFSILVRFRKELVALEGDVSQM